MLAISKEFGGDLDSDEFPQNVWYSDYNSYQQNFWCKQWLHVFAKFIIKETLSKRKKYTSMQRDMHEMKGQS